MVVISVVSPFFNILQKDNMDDVFLVAHLASQNLEEEMTSVEMRICYHSISYCWKCMKSHYHVALNKITYTHTHCN